MHGFPVLRVLFAAPTPHGASASVRLVLSVGILGGQLLLQDRMGPPRFLDASISARAVLSDPAGVSGSPRLLRATYLGLPGFRPCRPPDHYHEAQSLHLRYGPSIALSTLNSCRYLHEPKTRFSVGRLFPLPRREFHPLEAPGLSWRTEVLGQIDINDGTHPSKETAPNFRLGAML